MPESQSVMIGRLDAGEVPLLQDSIPASHRIVDGTSRTYHETRLMAQQEGTADYLIAWVDGSPVGHAFIRWGADEPFLCEQDRSVALVEALAVRPEMQRKGIATAIMLEAERMAANRGHTRIGLAVGIENTGARAMYFVLGYREDGRESFRVTWMHTDSDGKERERGETCIYMLKMLRRESQSGEPARLTL
jgi:GNAT superfamily N-acetyltransferase